MVVSVVIEVEYDVDTEEEARALAHRDASFLIQRPDVLAVAAGPKGESLDLPITERYLEDPA